LKFKILYVYQYFGTPNGSWSTRVYELTRRWVQEGHEVEVITAPYEKSDLKVTRFIEKQEIEGIRLNIINTADSNRHSILKRAINALMFSCISIWFALTKKYDIIITSSGPITVGFPLIAAKMLRRKKTVFEVRDLWPDGAIEMGKIKSSILISLAKFFEKLCYKNANIVIAASTGMAEGVKKIVPNKNILVIPNGSDIELFSSDSNNPLLWENRFEQSKIILYTGSLGEMDECHTAIKAMQAFVDKNLYLIFLGDGIKKEELELLASNISDQIVFLGLLPKTEVVKWYAKADASLVGFEKFNVLQTSSPNKMFDSLAAGVPIIQNTRGWIKVMISDTDCGINVRYGEVADYVEAFNQVFETSVWRDKRMNAKQAALKLFDRNILAQQYLNALLQLK
jgi:glycosyltransferase involved in cell wall biosynthesis